MSCKLIELMTVEIRAIVVQRCYMTVSISEVVWRNRKHYMAICVYVVTSISRASGEPSSLSLSLYMSYL